MKTNIQNKRGRRRVAPTHQPQEPVDDALVGEQAKTASSINEWQTPEPFLTSAFSRKAASKGARLSGPLKPADLAKVIRELFQSLRLELAIISSELSVRATPPFKPIFVVTMSSFHERLVRDCDEVMSLMGSMPDDHSQKYVLDELMCRRYIYDAHTCYKLVHYAIHSQDTQKIKDTVFALETAGRRFEEYLSISPFLQSYAPAVVVSIFPVGPTGGETFKRVLEEAALRSEFKERFSNVDLRSDRTYTDEVSLGDDIQRLMNSAHIPADAREAFELSIRRLIFESCRPSVSGVQPKLETSAQLKMQKEASLPLPKKKDVVRYDQRHKYPELQDLAIIEFLKAVWGPWMEARSLTRATLRKLDPSAEHAIQNWLRKAPDRKLPPDIHLPKQREVYDEVLARDPAAPWKSPKIASALGMRLRRQAPKS